MANSGSISFAPARGCYLILGTLFFVVPPAALSLIVFFPSIASLLVPTFSFAASSIGIYLLRRLHLADKAIRANEAYFRELADCTPGMIWVTNDAGYRTYLNSACLEFTGRELKQELGLGWLSSVHIEDAQDTYDKFLSTSQCRLPTRLIYRLKRADGSDRTVLDLGAPRYDSEGNFAGYIGFITDIEQQKQTERLLEAALKSRDEFISVASHELRTPLTSLKLFLQMTQRIHDRNDRLVSSREVSSICESSLKQVKSIEHLVENFLDVTRIRSGNLTLCPERVGIADLIRRVVSRFTESASHSGNVISIQADETLAGEWDPYRIEQMLDNLVSNSIRHAPGRPIFISAHRENDQMVLRVRDEGPGIPNERLAEAFENYSRPLGSKLNLGMGLGLYITRGLVGAHQGVVEVENSHALGASIKIVLPLAAEWVLSAKQNAELETIGFGA